jgi:hypothetical protein
MKPKEKAKDIYKKMDVIHYVKLHSKPKHKGLPVSMHKSQIKQSALICVDEIIKATQKETINYNGTGVEVIPMKYWEEVKKEIEKL